MADDEPAGETQSTTARWWLTNDLIAGWLLVSYVCLVGLDGLGLIALEAVPTVLVQALAVFAGIAVAWAFGTDAVSAWRGK